MQQIGLISAMVLLISPDGCSLDWDPAKGWAQPVLLPKLPSARPETT